VLKESLIDFSILFYNPNIDTEDEYFFRKGEVIKYASRSGVEFYDFDYGHEAWVSRIKGLEREPERGRRCSACFDLRMEVSASFAYENGFDIFISSIGISRYKNFDQLLESGIRAASKYKGMVYWDFNFRKNGGSERTEGLAKEQRFYRQKYCGCIYSKR
jgi:predicted adenine nucleotide alpha hydrolase (AANH) superfamily ATPase